MITSAELNRAFHIAYCLHPDRAVAMKVLLDACDQIDVFLKNQQRLPLTRHPYLQRIPREGILQACVFRASDAWERDQENVTPHKLPRYRPGRDDFLIRYVKFLVWQGILRHSSFYTALGVGCFLYRYLPSEIANLSIDHFDQFNIRRQKSTLTEHLINRFPSAQLLDGGKQFKMRKPNECDLEMIGEAMEIFAPWLPPDLAITEFNGYLLDKYFGYSSSHSEWERKHILVSPKCGGLARLILEYNASLTKGSSVKLRNPEENLFVPDFDFVPSKRDDRFQPEPLGQTELVALQHTVERNQEQKRKQILPFIDRYLIRGCRLRLLRHKALSNC